MRYQDHKGPILLAHRGGAGEFPENSIDAFQSAVRLGFTHLETDVRASKDDMLYLVHNATSYLPNRSLKLGAKSLTTLEELFLLFPNCFFAIDPKHDRAIEPLAQLIVRHNMMERVCIGSSFDYRTEEVARLVQKLSGKRPCTSLVSAGALSRLWLSSIGVPIKQKNLKATYVHIPAWLITKRIIGTAHKKGLKVIAWVLNDEMSIQKALTQGVDGYMTDYPSVSSQVTEVVS